MESKKKVLLLIVSILGVIGIVFGLSYAWFVLTVKGEKTNAIKAGELSLLLNETGDALNITDAFPVTDEEGLKGVGTTFTLRNDGTKNVEYKIKLLYDENSCNNCKKMPSSAVKYSLIRNQVESERANLGANNNVLESGVINGKTSYSYELKIWLDENAGNDAQNAYFYGKLEIEAVQTNLIGPADESCFTFNSGTITGYSNSCTKDLVIPETINGEAVTAIGVNAFNSKHLKTVEMPNGITTIGNSAFVENQLTSVTLSEGLKEIGDRAFYGNKLANVTIPNSVETMQRLAFAHNQLTSINIPNSVTNMGGGVFAHNRLPDEQAFIYARNSDGSENQTKLDSYAGAKKENVIIPNNVKVIQNEAFYYDLLKSVTIPNSVTSIGANAFYGNYLTSITIPNSVTSIGAYAFKFNDLTSIYLPETSITFGYGSFNDNQLPDEEAFIYARKSDGSIDTTKIVSYGGAKRADVAIPNGVSTIGEASFMGNQLKSVIIPSSVTSIEYAAFWKNQLKSIIIPSSVIKLSREAFRDNQLTSVVIKGKANSSAFTTYGSNIWGWASGYSDSNITWNG